MKTNWKETMCVLIWFLAVSLVLWNVGCTSRFDPDAFVQRYVALHRSGDIDGLLALHTKDAEFIIPGQNPIRGRKALRDLLEWDRVLQSELDMDSIRMNGDTIVIDVVTETSKWFRAIGVSKARYGPGTRFVLRHGRIVGIYPASFDDETRDRVIRQFGRLAEWLTRNRPEVLDQLLPEGKFQYNAASARLWLTVLEEWNNATR